MTAHRNYYSLAFLYCSILVRIAAKEEVAKEEEVRHWNLPRVKEWQVQDDFPNPTMATTTNNNNNAKEENHCRIHSNRICDPDGIFAALQKEEQEQQDTIDDSSSSVTIQAMIDQLEMTRQYSGICYYVPSNNPESSGPPQQQQDTTSIQFAVAIVKKLDLTPYSNYADREIKAAETLARNIHDKWGVGIMTPCGGTGVLIFLSILDRVVYISRGKALEGILTDARMDRTIDNVMKPFLQNYDYPGAIVAAVKALDSLMQSGRPNFAERLSDFINNYLGLIFALAFCFALSYKIYQENLERRWYAQVASHLDELDRARAEVLQGQYRAISCPICLEPFRKDEDDDDDDHENTRDPKNKKKMNFTKGSDGRPIKLLRCGHVFDESCWEEWVSSGTGQINKCPICKQDVGRSLSDASATVVAPNTRVRSPQQQPQERGVENEQQQQEQQQLVVAGEEQEQLLPREESMGNDEMQQELQLQQQRALRQYTVERQFRLARLGLQFPQYIGQQQIQRWTESAYDGALARDPTFVQNDPSLRTSSTSSNDGNSHGNNNYGSTGSGFGGASSSGGRGGRW